MDMCALIWRRAAHVLRYTLCRAPDRIVRGVTNCSDSCGFKTRDSFPNCTTVGPTHAWAWGGGSCGRSGRQNPGSGKAGEKMNI